MNHDLPKTQSTMKNKYLILDDGGETLDRYTIVNLKDGEMIGASDDPFHPLGFGQYCGNVADNYWNRAYGYEWRRGCTPALLAKRIKYAVSLFAADCANIGKPIKWGQLPADVQKFAKQYFSEEIPA
jgi:hypothetical protein